MGACILGAGTPWLIGGILLGLVIPFTLIVILPANRQLLSPVLAKDPLGAAQLLDRWGKLHAVRSILSFISFLFFLFSLSQRFH